MSTRYSFIQRRLSDGRDSLEEELSLTMVRVEMGQIQAPWKKTDLNQPSGGDKYWPAD